MPERILCTRPNAPTSIHDHEFDPHERGSLSRDALPDELVIKLLKVPGYEVFNAPESKPEPEAVDPATSTKPKKGAA